MMILRLFSSLLLSLVLLVTTMGFAMQPSYSYQGEQDSMFLVSNPPPIYTGRIFGYDPKKPRSARYSIENIRDKLLPGIALWGGGFLGSIAVLFLIWAGIQFLTAAGEPEKIGQATKTAFYVVAAVLLMSFSYALVYLFLTIFSPTP